LGQFRGSVAENRAATRINKGPLRFPDQLGGAADLSGMAFGEDLVAGQVDAIDRSVVAAGLENILRDIDEDGAGAAAGGDVESFVDDLRELGQSLHHEVVFGGRARDAE